MLADALTHHIFCTDEVSLEHQFIWDTSSGCLALTFEPEVLDFDCYVCISSTLVHIVVEVMLARSHCSEGERETWLARCNQTLNVIRESNDTASDLQIKVAK